MSPLHSPTPVTMETPGSVEEGGLTHVLPAQNNVTTVTSTTSSSELTNQIAPLQSRDSRTPPPPHGVDSLHIPPPRMLSKSAAPLRRSARLSGIGKPSASSRRLSDLVIHVGLMLLSYTLLRLSACDQSFHLLFTEHSCKISAQVTDETKCGNCRKEGKYS